MIFQLEPGKSFKFSVATIIILIVLKLIKTGCLNLLPIEEDFNNFELGPQQTARLVKFKKGFTLNQLEELVKKNKGLSVQQIEYTQGEISGGFSFETNDFAKGLKEFKKQQKEADDFLSIIEDDLSDEELFTTDLDPEELNELKKLKEFTRQIPTTNEETDPTLELLAANEPAKLKNSPLIIRQAIINSTKQQTKKIKQNPQIKSNQKYKPVNSCTVRVLKSFID